jgi:hypothetical protein
MARLLMELLFKKEKGVLGNLSSAGNEIPPINERGSDSTSTSLNDSNSLTRRKRSGDRSPNHTKYIPRKKCTKSDKPDKPDRGSLLLTRIRLYNRNRHPIIVLCVIFIPTRNPDESIDGVYTIFCTDLELNRTFIGPVQGSISSKSTSRSETCLLSKLDSSILIIREIGFSRVGQILLG